VFSYWQMLESVNTEQNTSYVDVNTKVQFFGRVLLFSFTYS